MKLNIRYATKERKWVSASIYENISKDADLEPIRIIRIPCGRGAAANRYYYDAIFIAPTDAEYVFEDQIRVNINRKQNPNFNPKKIKWEGSVAICNTGKLACSDGKGD